jgi:multicomponent Na+:H+ antiporter subunit D
MIQHFPVMAVMLLFLGAFLVAIFGRISPVIRDGIAILIATISLVLIYALIKPVMIDGQIISYWMGNWEPVEGYAIGIGYEVDALGLFFALLVVTTFWLSGIYSLGYLKKDANKMHYYTLYLMLSASVLGLVLTGDLFNMFIMIEIMTFASVALTAFRNKEAIALEAGFKYLVLGSIGSSMTLAGVALMYRVCHTLNMAQISSIIGGKFNLTTIMAFGLIVAGLGVKSYIVPFHTPAADAYTAAPTSISMIFSGMVNKAGVYGIIRMVYVVFRAMDRSSIQILLVVFGAVTMFIGVTMALAQHDFKRLLAFHSISQIGYVITAIGLGTALGLNAGLFHAMNHTLFKGLLFLTAGAVLTATGTTNLDKLGGLSKRMPVTTVCFLVGAFSISGLPPFNGFASKWMVYQAIYTKAVESGNILFAIATITALIVSVMTLASFIKVTQAVFFGQANPEHTDVKEVPLSMRIPMIIMAVLCVLTGVFYNVVYRFLLAPAAQAALSVRNYIDMMMNDRMTGASYSAAAGVTDIESVPASFSFWNPLVWLLLFVVIFLGVYIFMATSKSTRGRMLEGGEGYDPKYATFFSGEQEEFSQVGGSDLFWGFKTDWKGYYRIMQGLHSGIVTDYASYIVIGAAIIILVIFICMR